VVLIVLNNPLPSRIIRGAICAAMLIGLPLAGLAAINLDIGSYLEFPPITRYVVHAPFDPLAFGIIGALDIMMLLGIAILLKRANSRHLRTTIQHQQAFPLWGWWGAIIMLAGWVLAWTRLRWFEPMQAHTFCIPWVGYILLVNALCVQRSGRSLITDAPGKFLILFPVSAIFWWFFEYLNRFVQNWYYVEVGDFGPAEYALLASTAFATVLPAVLSTHRLLLTLPVFNPGLSALRPIPLPHGRMPAAAVLLVAGGGLAFIGIYPDYLYPLVWFAPLLIIASLQALWDRPTIFTELRWGDWRSILAPATAALICGFFWEMWNFHSLTRWEYAIPFVDRFHIFAMPLLGYGGYLPFGLECLAIGQMAMGRNLLAPESQRGCTGQKCQSMASLSRD